MLKQSLADWPWRWKHYDPSKRHTSYQSTQRNIQEDLNLPLFCYCPEGNFYEQMSVSHSNFPLRTRYEPIYVGKWWWKSIWPKERIRIQIRNVTPTLVHNARHLSVGATTGGHTRKSAPAKQRIYIWRPDLSRVATFTRGHDDNATIRYIKKAPPSKNRCVSNNCYNGRVRSFLKSFKISCERSAWIGEFSPCTNLESFGGPSQRSSKRNDGSTGNFWTRNSRCLHVCVALNWQSIFIRVVKLHTQRKTQGWRET